MKKSIIIFFSGFILAALTFTAVPAIAESINVNINQVTVASEGTVIEEPTLLWDNKTYIPLRSTLENADCNVIYSDSTKVAYVFNNYRHYNEDYLRINGTMVPQEYVLVHYGKDNSLSIYLDMAYVVQQFKLYTSSATINGNDILDFTTYDSSISSSQQTSGNNYSATTTIPEISFPDIPDLPGTSDTSSPTDSSDNYAKAKLELKQLKESMAAQGLSGSGYEQIQQQAIADKYGIPLSQLIN